MSLEQFPASDRRVRAILSLLQERFSDEVSVQELARAVNLSARHLSHLFKRETSMTCLAFQRILRMEKAKGLLESTHLSVKQVMSQVGIRDQSHFVRDFEAKYGLSPAKFRLRFFSDVNIQQHGPRDSKMS